LSNVEKVSLKSLLISLTMLVGIAFTGLLLYYFFRDVNLTVAMLGLILIFASIISLLVLPQFIIKAMLNRKSLREKTKD
jgi:membrane protein YdbS with pleckstrin-like domain